MLWIGVGAARRRLEQVIRVAGTEPVFLHHHQHPVAVLISPARYTDLLLAAATPAATPAARPGHPAPRG